MTESQSPSNFITPKSIDNLSIAGLSVWLICLTITSINTDMDSYWVRIIAILISFIWSLSLFLKNKRWNKSYNYILVVVNAVLIYINAAGINTITRQSPFEGYGVKSEIENLRNPVVKSGILNLGEQINWYPDYQMVKYIDTLKQKLIIESFQSKKLFNEFSYIKDNIEYFTNDVSAREKIKIFLEPFGNSYKDSFDFGIMKSEMQKNIDSLNHEIQFLKDNPIKSSVTTFYTINGKQISAEDLADEYLQKNSILERKNLNLLSIIDLVKKNSGIPSATIDSLVKKVDY